MDDSGDAEAHRRLLALFGDRFDLLLHRRARTGMTLGIDAAYGRAADGGADYVFHCQDDWRFHTRGGFVSESLAVLGAEPDAMVVWVRDPADHELPLGRLRRAPRGDPGGAAYRRVLPLARWKGFTFNPGLRRLADWRAMAPVQRWWFEDYVQGYMRWMGMYGASLDRGWVVHTGEHHSTKPSYQAANEALARATGGGA